MSSAAEMDEVAHLLADISVTLEGRNNLSKEVDLPFSRVAERRVLLKQKNEVGLSPAFICKGRRKPAKKSFYLLDSDYALAKDLSTPEFEEDTRSSGPA